MGKYIREKDIAEKNIVRIEIFPKGIKKISGDGRLFIRDKNFVSYMKAFLNNTVTLILYLISVGCFYVAFTIVFASPLINILLGVIAVYIFLQACGNVDKKMEIGPYSKDKDDHPRPPHGDGPVMF